MFNWLLSLSIGFSMLITHFYLIVLGVEMNFSFPSINHFLMEKLNNVFLTRSSLKRSCSVIPDVNDELMGAAHQHGTGIHM